jgi:beta-galactosidase
LEFYEDAETMTLRAGDQRAVFAKATGALIAYGKEDDNLLLQGPQLNVWRGATDNDGIKLMMEQQIYKPLARWISWGLHKMEHRLDSIRLTENDEGQPVVEVVQRASGRERWDDFVHQQRYTLLPSGDLHVENAVTVDAELNDLPRVGVNLTLAPGLEELAWYGLGPWDNYNDRKAAAMVGLYRSTVDEQYVPYVMPQEHGNKSEVRWLTLTDGAGAGVRVEGEPTLEFSASHFSANDLYAARHTVDLKPRPEVLLNLDYGQRGLGTASCGPDALMHYRLTESEYRFAYRLKLIGAKTE